MSDTNPRRSAVIGAGQMGRGICHALLLAGSEVVAVEAHPDTAAAAPGHLAKAVAGSAERGDTRAHDGLLERFSVAPTLDAVKGCDLVIEAVPEDVELKQSVLSTAEGLVDDSCVLATNTSSLSVDGLAAVLRRPGQFIGLHFFNPVPASALVEIVVGTATDPDLVGRAQGWVALWGKTPVTVRDSPGFASSRLGVAIGLEAIRMLEEGVASAEDIDAAMTLGYKHPMGPLKLTDLVGLDTRLNIARHLESTLGPRFAPPALLVDLVAQGHVGRKSGQGFYSW